MVSPFVTAKNATFTSTRPKIQSTSDRTNARNTKEEYKKKVLRHARRQVEPETINKD
jgi:hypothetical protein